MAVYTLGVFFSILLINNKIQLYITNNSIETKELSFVLYFIIFIVFFLEYFPYSIITSKVQHLNNKFYIALQVVNSALI